jgi:hypothetical protein
MVDIVVEHHGILFSFKNIIFFIIKAVTLINMVEVILSTIKRDNSF